MKRIVEQLANNNNEKVDLEKLIAALTNDDVDFDKIHKTIKGT